MIQQEKYANKYYRGDLEVNENPHNVEDAPVNDSLEKYYLERCQYFYGMYSANQSFLGFGGEYKGRNFKTLRDHARGLQNVEKYKDLIDPKKKKGRHQGKRKLNISWRISMYLTKFRDIVKDKFRGVNKEPYTEAIDELARLEKETKYNEMKFLSKPETSQWLQALGVQAEVPEMEGLETEADVDLYKKMGGVRLGVEIMMKDALDVSRNESGWDILEDMLIDDMVDLNALGVSVIKDRGTGRLRYKYVDPARMSMRHSVYPDARDSDFKFFIETINIATIRAESDLPEEEIKKIETLYKGRYGNPNYSDYHARSGLRRDYANNGAYGYRYDVFNDYKVDVMTLYFVDTQVQRYVTGKHPSGSRIFDRVGPNAKLQSRDKKQGKKIEDIPMHNVYRCKWIVGTSFVYDYGIDHTVMREGSDGIKRPIIPIISFVGHEPSIIERCIGFDDDIQLATLKIRSILSKLPPAPRIIFDKSALLDSVTIADEKYSILEMLGEYQTSGIMIIESRDEAGIPGIDDDPNRKKPFYFVESGVQEDIRILQEQIQMALDGIRQVTGVNPVTDGTNMQGDMLKSVMSGMMAATNSALMPHIRSFIATLVKLYNVNANMWALLAMHGEIDINQLPIANQMFKNIKITKALASHDWGITINIETREDRQFLLQDLMMRKEMIPADIYFIIVNAIRNGDIKKAQLLMARHIKDAEQIAHQRQMQLVNAQTQGNAQAAQATVEAEAMKIDKEYDRKEKLTTHTTNERIREMERKAELDIEHTVVDNTTSNL